jgi:aryl-alcohol dehydrogenase-like predicted oxidoreductase
MARLSTTESLRALGHAYEAGITARRYGHGEAKAVLGRFARDKRDRVTIATKAGLFPPRRSTGLSILRTVARVAVAVKPSLRTLVGAEATVQAPRLAPHADLFEELERSIHAGLIKRYGTATRKAESAGIVTDDARHIAENVRAAREPLFNERELRLAASPSGSTGR